MIFLAVLFLWICTGILLHSKYRLIINGHKLKGEIVGFVKASKNKSSVSGYNYVVQFKYDGELHAAKTLQSKLGTIYGPPKIKKGKDCTIYFNPKYPEQVTMTGAYGMEIGAATLFALGMIGVIVFFMS